MKKGRLLVTLLLAIVFVLSVALVACDNTHKCESKCPDCNGCKNADCKEEACAKKCTCSDVAETLAQTIVKGVFRMDAENRYELIKFYEDGTFYAYGLMTEVVRGKYTVHENYATAIKYIDCGDNGNWDDGDSTTPKTTNQVIELFQEDGTTAASGIERKDEDIPKGSSLDNSVANNLIAYTDGWLHHVKIGAQTRSLRQNQNDTFSKDDEVAVLMHEFMIADNAANVSLISGMWTQQRRKVSLYDKSFEEAITDDAISEGTVTISGKVFTLKYEDNSTATVTLSEDGKTATFKRGEKTIELVEWKEAATVVAELQGAMKMASGTPAAQVTITLNDDGTFKLAGGSSAVNGTYVVNGTNIVFTGLTGYTVVSATIATESDKTVATVNLTAQHPQAGTLTGEIKGEVTGKLFGAVSVAAELTGAMKMASGNPAGQVTIVLYDDGTAKYTIKGSTETVLNGTYSVNGTSLTLNGLTGYEVKSATIAEAGGKTNVTVNLEATHPQAGTLTGEIKGEVTGDLLTVKLSKTVAKDAEGAFTVASNGMKFDMTVTFYSNGTVNISVASIGLNVNGKYSTENRQLVISDIGNLTLAKDSGTNLVLGGTASLGAGSSAVSATIACTPQELGALLA